MQALIRNAMGNSTSVIDGHTPSLFNENHMIPCYSYAQHGLYRPFDPYMQIDTARRFL
jgi:hypothetical protein